MAENKTKPVKTPKQDKIYTFTFNLPSLIGLCSGAVVALCAFFVLGVLLGRGYQPEKDVPELAMVMPSQAENKTGVVKGGVLKPEELGYMDDLKKNPEPLVKEERDKMHAEELEKAAEAEKKSAALKAQREAQLEALKQAKAAQAAKTEVAESGNKKQQTSSVAGAPVFDYVYQIASFLDEKKAAGFAGKLQKDGLNSYVESGKSGTKVYYRVFVKYTGTADSTSDMKAVVARYGIKKPLLRSKVEK